MPSTTLSVKYFSVSLKISICDPANMAFWLKRQTTRTFPEAWTRHFSAGIRTRHFLAGIRVQHTIPMAPDIGPRWISIVDMQEIATFDFYFHHLRILQSIRGITTVADWATLTTALSARIA